MAIYTLRCIILASTAAKIIKFPRISMEHQSEMKGYLGVLEGENIKCSMVQI